MNLPRRTVGSAIAVAVACLVITLAAMAPNVALADDAQTFRSLTESPFRGDNPYFYVVDDTLPGGSSAEPILCYCINLYKKFPGGQQNTKITSPTDQDLAGLVNGRVDTQTMRKLLYAGYPYDGAGIQQAHGLSDADFHYITQLAVWSLTDNQWYSFVIANRHGEALSDAYAELMRSFSGVTLPDGFDTDLYVCQDGKYQNLISTRYDDLPRVDRESSVSTFDLPVSKVVTGEHAAEAAGKTFTFEARPLDPANPMPEGTVDGVATTTAAVGEDGIGYADFGSVTFTARGTYSYVVSEVNDGQPGFTYAAPRTVTFFVDNVDGELMVTKVVATTGDGEEQLGSPLGCAIVNSYVPPTTPETPETPDTPDSPQTPETPTVPESPTTPDTDLTHAAKPKATPTTGDATDNGPSALLAILGIAGVIAGGVGMVRGRDRGRDNE